MKICYRDATFRGSSLEIIEEYQQQGFDLTLRQLYYQFVARGLLGNVDRNYKRLGSIISDARLAGLVSWLSIKDRMRPLYGTRHWDSPVDFVREQVRSYHIDKWEGQTHRIEIWVEKDALRDVVARAANRVDVNYFSCRGYTSQTAMWEASIRLRSYEEDKYEPIVLHLGDHDPSGIDMSRDIADRLEMFGCHATEVKRIALNMDQVEEQKPPPNPAKVTDSRYFSYISNYGRESWELDALDPAYMVNLIIEHVNKYRDQVAWDRMVEREEQHRELLERSCDEMEEWIEDDTTHGWEDEGIDV